MFHDSADRPSREAAIVHRLRRPWARPGAPCTSPTPTENKPPGRLPRGGAAYLVADMVKHRSLFVVRQFETDQAFREERLWLIRGLEFKRPAVDGASDGLRWWRV